MSEQAVPPRTLVIGATGQVGAGIVASLAARGHQVVAASRRIQQLGLANVECVQGSVASDEEAGALAEAVGEVSAVVVTVNAQRDATPILDLSTDGLAAHIGADLISHFTAARTFLPRLSTDGVFLGIGGGSADFILAGGVHMSMAQAALRMMYRGLASENAQPHIRQLIIASVVNSPLRRGEPDRLWVTDREIGDQVADIIERPLNFPAPIWRIARRDESGRPVFGREPDAATKVLPL